MSQQYLKIKGEKVVQAFVMCKIVQDDDNCYSEARCFCCTRGILYRLYQSVTRRCRRRREERASASARRLQMNRCGVAGGLRLILACPFFFV